TNTPVGQVSVTRSIYGYTPSVHRLLQVVANIYDATTNRADLTPTEPYLPHVYKPVFRRNANGTDVFIVGYQEVVDYNIMKDLLLGTAVVPMADLSLPADRQNKIPVLGAPFGTVATEPMVYGIPMVVGTRKGLPNFNKFALQNSMRVTRKVV